MQATGSMEQLQNDATSIEHDAQERCDHYTWTLFHKDQCFESKPAIVPADAVIFICHDFF